MSVRVMRQPLAVEENQGAIVDPPPISVKIDVARSTGTIWNQRGQRAEPLVVAERALAESEDHVVTVHLVAQLNQGRHDRAHVGDAHKPFEARRAGSGFEPGVHKLWLHIPEQLLVEARKTYALAEARYKIGGSSFVELRQAQLNTVSAEIGNAHTRYKTQLQEQILRFQTGAALQSFQFMSIMK